MPRFYFHIFDDLEVPDEEGVELPDLQSARREAVRNARSLACEQVSNGNLNLRHWIDVEDEGGAVVATVTFGEAIDVSF